MPTKLKDLSITRVDLVGKGANQDGDGPEGSHVVFFKRAAGAIKNALTKKSPTEEPQMPEQTKKLSEMTKEELVAKEAEMATAAAEAVTKAEEQATATATLTTQVADLTAKLEKATGTEPDPDDVAKEDIPESVQKMLDDGKEAIAKAEERAVEAEKIAKEEREVRLAKQYQDEASTIPFIPGERDAIAKSLRSMDEHMEKDEAAVLRAGLVKANELLAQSPLFEKHSTRPTETSAHGQLQAIAKGIMEKDGVTKEKAFTMAVEANKELAQQFRAEQ